MKLSTVDCSRGAPMGRSRRDITNAGPVKLHLQQVKLDSGGYDEGGAYWGLRQREKWTRPDGIEVMVTKQIYWYWWNGNRANATGPVVIQGFIDAVNRADAKRLILEQYPEATFYR